MRREKAITTALAATVALALVSVPGTVRAQTARLYLQRIAQRPAEILLVPGFLTILEFEDAVTAVATGNPAIVELVDVTGGTVMLRPRTGSGATDIVVAVADVRALFRARVASQPRSTHKYLITSSPPPEPERSDPQAHTGKPATQVSARVPAPQPSPAPRREPGQAQQSTDWDRFVRTLTPAQQALLVDLMRELTFDRLWQFLAALSPEQRDMFLRVARFRGLQVPQQAPRQEQPATLPSAQGPSAPSTQAGSGPDWLDWRLTAQRTAAGTVLHYTLTNNGQRVVLTDLLKLQVTAGGKPARYTLTRINPSGYAGRINPGETEAGTIALQGDPGGPIALEWRVTEVGSGAVHTLVRTVQ